MLHDGSRKVRRITERNGIFSERKAFKEEERETGGNLFFWKELWGTINIADGGGGGKFDGDRKSIKRYQKENAKKK